MRDPFSTFVGRGGGGDELGSSSSTKRELLRDDQWKPNALFRISFNVIRNAPAASSEVMNRIESMTKEVMSTENPDWRVSTFSRFSDLRWHREERNDD